MCEMYSPLIGKAEICTQQSKGWLSIDGNCSRLSLLLSHTQVPIKLSGRCFGLNTPGSNFIENQHKSWAPISSHSPKKQLSQSDSSAGLMRGNQISRLKSKALCHRVQLPSGQCPFCIWFHSYTSPTYFLWRGKKQQQPKANRAVWWARCIKSIPLAQENAVLMSKRRSSLWCVS